MPIYQQELNRIASNDPSLRVLDLRDIKPIFSDLKDLLDRLETNTHLIRIRWPSQLPNDKQSDEYLSNINERIRENNERYRHYPTHYEYAHLSVHVYENLRINQAVVLSGDKNKPERFLAGWTVLDH